MKVSLYRRCFLLQLRWFSNSKLSSSASNSDSTEKKFRELDKIFFPWEPHTPSALAKKLAGELLYYSPGDVVVVNKPYGVSCLGYRQPGGGVFKPSRYDQRPEFLAAASGADDFEAAAKIFATQHDEAPADQVTLEKALPILAEMLDEPKLHFCIGLSRYVSGPVVLPCSKKAFAKIKKSFFHANSSQYTEQYLYRALAICMEKPAENEGKSLGYSTFQKARNVKEYVFVPNGKVSKRAVSGKFAVMSQLKYRVLATGFDCSLIDLQFTKFSRHLPRLILSFLGAPIVGDPIYDRRLIDVDGKPVVVEPKDRWRGEKQPYIPRRLLDLMNVKSYEEVRTKIPLMLSVYESNYPLFGESKKERNTTLTARAKPPDHFYAMAKLLKFDRQLHSFLKNLEDQEEGVEPPTVGKDCAY